MALSKIRSSDYDGDPDVTDGSKAAHKGANTMATRDERNTAAAKAVANLNANSSTEDLEKALAAIQADALERGDTTGAILISQLQPKQPGQA